MPRSRAVVVWVTNNPAVLRWVVDTLLPAWGLRACGTIVWVKLTGDGVPVLPPASAHRKPTECAIVARPKGDGDDHPAAPAAAPSPALAVLAPDTPPPHTWIASPSVAHSCKPPLDGVLGDGAAPRRLELFARNLRRGWHSVGTEVLVRQQLGTFLVERRGDGPAA